MEGEACYNSSCALMYTYIQDMYSIAGNSGPIGSFPGYSQILSHSCGEKSIEMGALLRHGPEMVDSVST